MDYSNEFKDLIDLNNLSERLNDLIYSSEYKPKFQLNLLDTIGVKETLVSKIISLIFNYKYNNQYILCQSFVQEFLCGSGFDVEWIQNPKIMAETARIDIRILEQDKYAIIIENKVKGAPFQRNQIARYIQKMIESGYNENRIFIVILPNYVDRLFFENINQSIWYLPKDWKSPNQKRMCKDKDDISCLCDYGKTCPICRECNKDLKDKFKNRTVILDKEFINWLENKCLSLLPLDEHLLRSAIIQFVDFLKGLFNNRLNNKLIMEIEEFLRQQLIVSDESLEGQWNIIEKKKEKVIMLIDSLKNLQNSIGKKQVDEWREQLMPKWESYGLRYIENESFGIEIEKKFWCGCWCLKEEQPFWGFQCDLPTTEKEEKVKKILKKIGYQELPNHNKTKGWISWDYTWNGYERCDNFFEAAVDCDYLKKIESN